MDTTKNRYNFAEAIAYRNRLKVLNDKLTKKENEVETFFYWCMTQMVLKIENSKASSRHEISILATARDVCGHWTAFFSDSYEGHRYYSKTTSNQFETMKNVADIINTLPNFTATYRDEIHRSYMTIVLETSEN